MTAMTDVRQISVNKSISVRECMEIINTTKLGVVLVTDQSSRLIGTVTDGDIRRFLLSGHTIDQRLSEMMWPKPVTGSVDDSEFDLVQKMKNASVKHLPVVDKDGRACKIVTMRDLFLQKDQDCIAVIMAGGEGKRLRPTTRAIPKPMVKVAGKPIMETIIGQMVSAGIKRKFISLNYRGEVIEEYFGNGEQYGADISYLREDQKLGTAGALSLLPEVPTVPILTINGDILTEVDYSSLLAFHLEHRSVMTVAGVEYKFRVPYGVLKLAGHYLLGVEEKPEQKMLCNAGIYILNPELMHIISQNMEFDMTDLIQEIVARGLPISAFPIYEYWIDVGKREDLKRARLDRKGTDGTILEK